MLGLRSSPFKRQSSEQPGDPTKSNDMTIDASKIENRYRDTDTKTRTHNHPYSPQPAMAKPVNGLSNGHGHGTSNGVKSQSGSIISTQRSETRGTVSSYSSEQQITILHESIISVRRNFIADLDDVEEATIEGIGMEDVFEYIERQRLTHMPHRGSHWDKVLKWAEFFAVQMSGYAAAVEPFAPEGKAAARLIWIATQNLLSLGPENAQALEITFGVFYRLGLSVSTLLQDSTLLSANREIRKQVAQGLSSILLLVHDVTFYYHQQLHGNSRETRIDFNDVFGRKIAAFYQLKNHVVDAMWEHTLGDEAAMEVRVLRKWLGPQDAGLQKLLKADDSVPNHREEFTCEWFQSHLLAFTRSKNDTLAAHAAPGYGKSVLANWIMERLQRPIGKKTYVVLSCTLEADAPVENTSLAIVKRLLLQMLAIDLGDKKLFRALVEAYRVSTTNSSSKLEKMLWDCLDIALRRFQEEDYAMILVDGIDEIQGGDAVAKAVVDKLGSFCAKYTNIQAITMSRHSSLKPSNGKTQSFAISADHTHEDLRLVINHRLENHKHFSSRNEHLRESLVEQLLHAAKGNFLWAIMTAALATKETSEEGFLKFVKAAKDTPLTLEATIARLINTVDFSKPDTSLLLSLILVANRPLTTTELKQLSQIDLAKKNSQERKTDIVKDLRAAFGPLVVIRNDYVRFCHSTIRSHLLQVQEEGKKLRSRSIAHSDMATRLLAYCTFNLPISADSSFEPARKAETDKLFSAHVLLGYATRNWTAHFQYSTMYQSNETFHLEDSFKAVFPHTTLLALLEWASWGSGTSKSEAMLALDLALRVRQVALSEKHVCTLQSLIVCGSVWRETTLTTESAHYFYRASTIGKQILSKYHAIIALCTTAFLEVTNTVTVTTRTELVTRREEMLIYTIEMYKYQHGKTHDLVIRYYKMLAQLYVEIHEEHKAETIWRELREVVIIRYGKGSQEEVSISENLTFILKKGDKKTDVIEYEQGIFDIVTELEVWDVRRIKLTIELALSYEARGEFRMAEELYIFLWTRLTEQCHHSHHHHGVDIHIRLIDVVIEYVRFLRRCHRHEEASSVLICIWTEYEEYDFESEVIFLRLKVVGELMRAVSLLSVAVSVFKKCWAWFKSHSKHEHTSSCEVLISETIEEITTISTTSTTTMSTSTTKTSTETVIREIFESSLTRSIVTTETISVCKSLVAHYMKIEQWSLAIETTIRSLTLIWRSVIASSGTIALPKEFAAGAIDIAINLAICHHRSHHFHEAEEIYVRVYRACRNSCSIDDERLSKACTALIKFYAESRHWHKLIEIHRELLIEYQEHLGSSHNFTIRTLYTLGSLCADHGHGHAHEYYEEIIRVLNRSSHVCHHDALDAMIVICRYHYEAGHWQKLQSVCKILWETWKGQHRGHDKFTVDFVEILYFRYRYVLEHHVHCELSVLRELIIEYRNICHKVFGATVAITVKAMIELAQICMRSEKHIHEAITIYEEVLTQTKTSTTKTVVSTTTITTVRQRLTEAYVSVCRHDSVSSTTIERAIMVVLERYEYLRLTYGWAHTETLTVLREVVLLYIKSKKQESHATVTRILLEAVIQIIVKEKHSQTLHEAGRTVGQIFISCGITQVALEIIHELRLQLITGAASSDNKHGIKLDKSAGRSSFVFLVTLEQVVNGTLSISYAQVMADYLTESILYESYTHSLKSSATVIISHAARLRAFLFSHERHSQRKVLESQSYDIFVKKWSINARSREIGILFYVSLLVQIGDSIRDVQVGNVACQSAVVEVRRLRDAGRIQQAYEVAECALDFIKHQRSYHHLQNIPAGFKLSSLLAMRGMDASMKSKIDHKLRENMFELSRKIIREVLEACKESKIDFVRLKLHELNDLVGLLGEQQNYADLESILSLLWASREVQKTWQPHTIISIGRLLIQSRFLHPSKEHRSNALRLCEDICYNMRRTWGSLDPKTLQMSDLLAELYTSMGHYREAQGVHENVLRLVVEGDDGDDRTLDTMTPERVVQQVELLRQSFLRLKGWDKSPEIYTELINDLKNMPEFRNLKDFREMRLPAEWNLKDQASETLGKFAPPEEWDFVEEGKGNGRKDGKNRRPGMGVKRATSNWGLGLVHRFLHGGEGEEDMPKGAKEVAKNGGRYGGVNGGGKVYGSVNGNGKAIAGKKTIGLDDDEGFESAEEGTVHVL